MLNQIIRYAPILKLIKKNTPTSILEIGSGSQGLGKFYQGPFTGVDMTTKDYGKSDNITVKNMKFIEGSALDLPFKSNTYDFVFSLDMIEHIPIEKRLTAIRESIRVSKKNICVGFPCGKYARKFDTGQYLFLKKLGVDVPGWLQEHIDLELPTDHDFEEIISTIKEENPMLQIQTFGNGNIYIRACIIWFEHLCSMMRILSVSELLAKYVGFLKNISRKTECPYRRFILLTKND